MRVYDYKPVGNSLIGDDAAELAAFVYNQLSNPNSDADRLTHVILDLRFVRQFANGTHLTIENAIRTCRKHGGDVYIVGGKRRFKPIVNRMKPVLKGVQIFKTVEEAKEAFAATESTHH